MSDGRDRRKVPDIQGKKERVVAEERATGGWMRTSRLGILESGCEPARSTQYGDADSAMEKERMSGVGQ
jgi:hypothetical protein